MKEGTNLIPKNGGEIALHHAYLVRSDDRFYVLFPKGKKDERSS